MECNIILENKEFISFHFFFPGGWLLVSNVVVDNPSSLQYSVESSYHEISNCHNKSLLLTADAMMELRTHLSFTQLRFHCSKNKGRTLHLTTAANSSGEAVVQYFSGQTDANSKACGSFVRMNDDNSKLPADDKASSLSFIWYLFLCEYIMLQSRHHRDHQNHFITLKISDNTLLLLLSLSTPNKYLLWEQIA